VSGKKQQVRSWSRPEAFTTFILDVAKSKVGRI